MARIILNKAQVEKLLPIEKGLEEKAKKVLRKLRDTAPRDTGDLANSLRIEKRVERGKLVVRIVSDDPQIKDILKGTKGPYGSVPPSGPDSALGGWGRRHGFTTVRSLFALAKSIANHGTKPAGTFNNNADWIKEATREIK